jgi:hypothetical protein
LLEHELRSQFPVEKLASIMEPSENSVELTGLGGDEITSKEEPGTADQSLEENASGPEFNPNWRFYLAFASLAVVTLAVRIFSDCPPACETLGSTFLVEASRQL